MTRFGKWLVGGTIVFAVLIVALAVMTHMLGGSPLPGVTFDRLALRLAVCTPRPLHDCTMHFGGARGTMQVRVMDLPAVDCGRQFTLAFDACANHGGERTPENYAVCLLSHGVYDEHVQWTPSPERLRPGEVRLQCDAGFAQTTMPPRMFGF